MKKTVLIFGISSFVGSTLAEFLKRDYRVVGTYFEHNVKIADVLTIECDILNRDAVQILIYTFRPDYTIYAVGLTSLLECARDEKISHALNTVGLFNVNTYTERYKSQLIYLSTSFVFSGLNRIFGENDSPYPNSSYGRMKSQAEFFLQKSCLNYLIFRCSLFYGRSLNPRQRTKFEMLQKNILLGKPTMCDDNIVMGFIDVYYLAILLKFSFERGISNRLFQVSSRDYVTFYEFAKMYCKVFGYTEDLLVRGSWYFPAEKSELSEAATEVEEEQNKTQQFYKLRVTNVEAFFEIKMPSVMESLIFTHDRLYGTGKTKEKSAKKAVSNNIQFI